MRIPSLLFAMLIVAQTVPAQAQTAPSTNASSSGVTTAAANDGTSTGQRIGNLIAAVISTAFPAVDKVITAIWPNATTSPKDTKTAAQAKPSLDAAKTQADQAQQKSLTQMTAIAQNLAVASSFATACSDVDARVAVIRAMLPKQGQLTAGQIKKLQDIWRPANQSLQDLQQSTLQDAVSKLDDNFLKSTFQAVQKAIHDTGANIPVQIGDGRIDDLKDSFNELEPKLAAIGPLTAILVGDMSASIRSAAAKLSGAAGPAEKARDAAIESLRRKRNVSLVVGLQRLNARPISEWNL